MMLPRTGVIQLFSLFDFAYKKGVIDASEINDDVFCHDFLERRKAPDVFGTLDCPHEMDEDEWIFTVKRWCLTNHKKLLYDWLVSPSTCFSNFKVAYSVVQGFYVEGVKDWLEYENMNLIEVFKTRTGAKWGATLSIPGLDKKVSMVQNICYQYEHAYPAPAPRKYRNFGLDIWRLTRTVPKREPRCLK